MSVHEVTLVAALVVLVIALFGLALAETSLLHVRRSAAAVEADLGDRRAAGLVLLLDDLPRVMNTVLLVVLLAQVAAAGIAGELARRWFGGSGLTIATAAVTMVLFIYGEAIPKTLAVRHPLGVALRLVAAVRCLRDLARPVVRVLVWIADVQTRESGVDAVTGVSEAELRHLAGVAASAGHIEPSDAELIERSFIFGDLHVGQICVPRRDMVAVSMDTSVASALRTAIAAGHRRLPVFEAGLERVAGFVRMRDLADASSADPDATVAGRVQEVLTVPASERLTDLLRLMQRSGRHLAVVLDEAGRTKGIATIEDVVEELVGTIEDT
ncbi:MAG: CNNM domain-containing protein [Acidimicrobiia bacterium]|nr:CNNM domain-containing protein [Acidimicrobiia bacterium]